MYYKDFAAKMRERMPEFLGSMDDKAIAELAIKRNPQHANRISFDEPVATQSQTVETQNNNSTPYIDAINNIQEDGLGGITAFKKQQELDKQSYDTNTITKEDAKRKLANLKKYKEEHPVISVIDDFTNASAPFKAQWELREKYGNNAPWQEEAKTLVKQGVLGGLGVASTVYPATALAKTLKIASIANNLSKAKRVNDAIKSAKYGAVITGVPALSNETEKVLNNEQGIGEAIPHITQETALGALGGLTGYGLTGVTAKPLTNSIAKKATEKFFAPAKLKPNQIFRQSDLDKFVAQETKKVMGSNLGAGIKTADGLVAGLGDAAVIGSADYGLNKLQGKQQEPYLEHMKPYMAFGAGAGLLPGVFHYAGKPVEKILNSNLVRNAINNNETISNIVGEGANALGVRTSIPNAKKYQELGELIKGYDMPVQKHYTSKEFAEIDSTKNLTPKEKRMYLNYLKNGVPKDEAFEKATSNSNSKFDEMHKKAQQEQAQSAQEQTNTSKFDEMKAKAEAEQPDFTENIFNNKEQEHPVVKNNIVPIEENTPNVVKKPLEHAEGSTSPVEHQGDINTPIEPQTHVNEPANHVKINNDDKTLNEAWRKVVSVNRNLVRKVGAKKYLENRFNGYNFEPAKTQKFYDRLIRKINNSKFSDDIKQDMFNQLNEVADNYAKKNNITINKKFGYKDVKTGNEVNNAHSQSSDETDIPITNSQKTSFKYKDEDTQKAYKFLEGDFVDEIVDEIDNVITSSRTLQDKIPVLKLFNDELADDIVIRFETKHFDSYFDKKNRVITLGQIEPRDNLFHELRHVCDLEYIAKNKAKNKDLEILEQYNEVVNTEYETARDAFLNYTANEDVFNIDVFDELSFKPFIKNAAEKQVNCPLEQRAIKASKSLFKKQESLEEMIGKLKETGKWDEMLDYLHYETSIFALERNKKYGQIRIYSNRKNGHNDKRNGRNLGNDTTSTMESQRKRNDKKQNRTTKSVQADFAQSKQRIKDLNNLSVDIEQKRLKRGLITPEQAENRKKQLNSKYYVPMHTDNTPIEDLLDLTKNYNQRRETKVGLYGEGGEWKDELTPEKAVENLHIASVKTNFVDEIADYVEKNCAKPLVNGRPQKDWVSVNAHLLWNGLAAKQSQEWYELIASGEKAIRKAFKNQKQADALVELHNRTKTQDFQIPKQVFKKLLSGEGETAKEAFERYGDSGYAKGKLVGALTDAFTDQFKRTVLSTSTFWVNNRFSNHLLLASNSENPAKYILDLVNAGKIKSKDMPQELLENSILEAVSTATKRRTFTGYNGFDNLVNLFGGHLIDTKTLKGIQKATASAGNAFIGIPNKFYNTIAEKLLNFNSKFENYERKVALLQQLRSHQRDVLKRTGQQMLTVEEALKQLDKNPELRSTVVKQVENVLGDYNNFTATEKQIIKRAIPFYSWYRTVLRNTLYLAKNKPERFALILFELEKLKNEDKDLEEWQKGSLRLPVKDKRSGKQLLLNKVNQVPWETLRQLGNESDVKNSVNPLLKIPAEAMFGKKFFGSGEITNKRYVSTYAGKNNDGSNKYNYIDTKTGKKINSLPLSTRSAYVAKELGKNFTPLLSNRLIGGESLLQAGADYAKTGKFLEPDKLYDADFGGYKHGDIAGQIYKKNKGYKPLKRYATNNTAEEIKLLNRAGLSLQPKQDLSKADIEKLKRVTEKYKKKRKAS